jgi:hypothetical protein
MKCLTADASQRFRPSMGVFLELDGLNPRKIEGVAFLHSDS